MRRLILLRHAKSDRPPGLSDADRPLNPRGRRAAPRIGAYMEEAGLRPDHAMVSPARRTVETWEAVRAVLGDIPCDLVPMIYEASAGRLRDAIRTAPDRAESVLVVGHNPGLQDLATELIGSGDRDLRARLETQFPTAALAVIDLDAGSWADIAWGSGRLERFVRPKDLQPDDED